MTWGLFYVKVKQGYEVVYGVEDENDQDLLNSAFGSSGDQVVANYVKHQAVEKEREVQRSNIISQLSFYRECCFTIENSWMQRRNSDTAVGVNQELEDQPLVCCAAGPCFYIHRRLE